MKIKCSAIFTTFLVMILLQFPLGITQGHELPPFALKPNTSDVMKIGKQISLTVEDFSDDASHIGFAREDVIKDIELKLSPYNFTIIKRGVPLFAYVPNIYVNLHVIKIREDYYAYHIDIILHRNVFLPETKQLIVGAIVWHKGSMNWVEAKKAIIIRDRIKTGIDEFLSDYLDCNPNEQK